MKLMLLLNGVDRNSENLRFLSKLDGLFLILFSSMYNQQYRAGKKETLFLLCCVLSFCHESGIYFLLHALS
jgi:hypothetical protein